MKDSGNLEIDRERGVSLVRGKCRGSVECFWVFVWMATTPIWEFG